MLDSLKEILSIQEFDIKMIRLMRLKKERQSELINIHALRSELQKQLKNKEADILEAKKNVNVLEGRLEEVQDKIKKYEAQQNKVKKVEEFNALSQEISHAERERTNVEQRLSDAMDILANEEEGLDSINQSISSTGESSVVFEDELNESIVSINEEGKALLVERKDREKNADPETLAIYDKLLRNKKDRVVVPMESRTCSGCHIVLTAQHENLVRKGERIVFCEHCSRILYWQESEAVEGTAAATKRRRRKSATI